MFIVVRVIFRYRLSPEAFGYPIVPPFSIHYQVTYDVKGSDRSPF